MGPKKEKGPSVKTENKKKEKIIEDKTFGLKNKNKSKVVQKYIKGVEQTVKGGKGAAAKEAELHEEKKLKKKLREEEAFLASLQKQVKTIKQAECSDEEGRKNVLCEFFKQGHCDAGDDCEFSHDLNIEFNQGTFDIYTDLRDAKAKLGIDYQLMEEMEAKRSKLPKTNIVCKFFLDAVKKRVYGFKWACPNGEECHYKHCLPKDYVIKTLQSKDQEEMTIDEFQDLEERIDEERERIAVNGTKVNDETFQAWKKKRKDKKDPDDKNLIKKLKTGRELFTSNKEAFKDDENALEEVLHNEVNQLELEEETKNLQGVLWQGEDIKVDKDLFQEEENLDNIDLEDDIEEENKEEVGNEDV